MKKIAGHNQNVKLYLNSKRRSKIKNMDNGISHMNYRTSTSSCSNHSYLNSSVISNHNKGTAYTDVLISRIPAELKQRKKASRDK